MAVKGVDISEFNGGVNFDALKKAGVEFVIIRTGFGSDYPGQQDKNFGVNVTACEISNMPFGVYHYSYAKDRQGGVEEAKHCLRILNGRTPAYGVWFDMEDASTIGGNLAAAAQGFCETIENAGRYVGVYANVGWWKNYLTDPIFDKWDKWVAQYYTECQYEGDYGIWQYTDKLVIGGKNFDGNWAYKDYPEITKDQEGKTMNSRVFSEQENGITKPYGNGHTGVDLGWKSYAGPNTPIISHSQGTVTYIQTGRVHDDSATGDASYGNLVKIKHPNGYYTLYAHLSQVDVAVGQNVDKGQKIGNMGDTGVASGPHLHFEVRNASDNWIDPTPYINADLPGLPTEEETMTEQQVRDIVATVNKETAEARAKEAVSSWAKDTVNDIMEYGIMEGDDNGKLEAFRPRDYITREEVAQVVLNLLDSDVLRDIVKDTLRDTE